MTEPPLTQDRQEEDYHAHTEHFFAEARLTCEILKTKPPPKDGLYCPPDFDGWVCFNYTRAASDAFVPCPRDLPIFNPNEKAHRYCEANGTWRFSFEHNRVWSNHSNCLKNRTEPDDSATNEAYSYVYLFIAGASLSLVLLIISLIIFFGFRQLRCDRVTVHKNLFISFALTCITWILYYRLVVLEGQVILDNPVWCRLLHVLAQYFTTTNFSWMCCEGLYLHIIMAHTLQTGKKLIKCLIIGGWGVPFLLTGLYAATRETVAEKNGRCWIEDDGVQWIIAGPILASVLINICILINLVRLLMTKLRQVPDAQQSRKAAKATLILVPLFGLQFLVFPVRPAEDSPLHDVYLHFMALLMSLQGTLVSIIFCFFNGEVRSLIMRKWHQHRLMSGRARKNTGFTSSTYVDGYSVVDTTRDGNSTRTKLVNHDAAPRAGSVRSGSNNFNNADAEALEMKSTNGASATTPLVEKQQQQQQQQQQRQPNTETKSLNPPVNEPV